MVIVPAFIEGDALVALNGKTGDVVWKQEVPGYTSNWSTPILVEANDRTDLVLSVPGEVWGLNPGNGKLRWYCEIPGSEDARASVVAHGDIVIAMAGGRGAKTSIAVRAGGKGDVQETHKVWQGTDVTSISTPVVHGEKLYMVN
jgi:outer membrane protein assembly factor BamB